MEPYHLIIDEVVDPFTTENSVRKVDFDEDYIAGGLAVLHDDGRIEPTAIWDDKYQRGSKTYNRALYERAKSGALYRLKENLYVTTLPTELFFNTKSVTVYTYLSEGSLLLPFLRKHQKDHPGKFTMEVQQLDCAAETAWREDVANALTVLSLPGLEKQKWNFRSQLDTIKKHDKCASLGHELRKLRDTQLAGVNLNNVMLTCARVRTRYPVIARI
ncbi:MAG: hypothetical protein U1E69_00245 [Tabrizicola sp.]|uniref:hypothetical protein n=1 Tax=Tabrizicola sp. TaxID=2005166 RepID=UPI002ABC8027|nr:hypothetical protein [Tabrizicola sp.]MDZ4085211.1 hypothetical protein [Tabrizicola sp.]